MEPAPPSARRPGRLPGARGRGRDPRPQGGGGAPPSAEPAPGSRRTIRVCVTLRIGLPSFSRYQWRESGLASLWPPCNRAWHATHGHLASAHVKRDRSAGRAPKRPRTCGRGKPWGVGWGGGTEGGAASVGTVLGGSAATPRSAASTGQSRGALSRMYAFISLAALHRRLLSGLSAPWCVAPPAVSNLSPPSTLQSASSLRRSRRVSAWQAVPASGRCRTFASEPCRARGPCLTVVAADP